MDISEKYWLRAESTVFNLEQLYDEGIGSFSKNQPPRFIKKGKNAHLWDLNDKEYIDYNMALGPILLGYCYDAVDNAVIQQLREGMLFSLTSPKEVEYAEFIKQNIPSAERVRCLKTGSSATEAAIRIARAYTNKKHIIRGYYHGWHEWTAAGEDYRQGGILPEVRANTHRVEYNDFDGMQAVFEKNKGDMAAVIIEPAILEAPKSNFLQNLLELCHSNGALLILDEVVTGFRYGLGGAQKYFNITPDISTFGKGAANGMPLSFVAGKAQIMDAVKDEVFLFTTFGGELLSIAAGLAVGKELLEKNVVERIWQIGGKLQKETKIIAERVGIDFELEGLNPRLNIKFGNGIDENAKKDRDYFMVECAKRGILFGWHVFPCFTHSDDDINKTLEVIESVLKKMKI